MNHHSRMHPKVWVHNGPADPCQKERNINSFSLMKRLGIALTIAVAIAFSQAAPANANQPPPNSERLSIWESIGSVSIGYSTNSSLSWEHRITGYVVKDKSGETLRPGSFFSSFYYSKTETNCWQVAAVNQYGQGPWSNEVCYSPPLPTKPTLYIYETLGEVKGYFTQPYGSLAVQGVKVRDNYGTMEQTPVFNIRILFEKNRSNCWEAAVVSAVGQSEWSNKVCYTAPVIHPVSISGIYMYLNAQGRMDGNVHIKWAKGSDSAGLYWTECASSDTWQPSDATWAYNQTSYSSSGQTVFSGHVSIGPRCKMVYAKSSAGILSAPFRVEYTFAKEMAQPHSASPSYVPLYPSERNSNSSGGYSSRSSSISQNCVGICYGVPSKVNGLPRNTYVSGYFRKDGTYVRPYTRSK